MKHNKNLASIMHNLILFVLPVALFAQTEINQTVTLKLIREIKVDKPIRDVSFVTFVKEGKEKLFPKIMICGEEIRFFDENFAEKKRIPLPEGGISMLTPDGKDIGVEVFRKIPSKEETGLKEFTVYDDTGRNVTQIEIEEEFEVVSWSFSISPLDGSVVAASGEKQYIIIYDKRGNILKKIDLYTADENALERGIKCSFSLNGYLVVVSTKNFVQFADNKTSGKPNIYLHLFGPNREQLWKKPIGEHSSLAGPWISKTGRYIIVSGEDIGKGSSGFLGRFIYLFNREGKLIRKIEIKFDKGAVPWGPIVKFSADERYVCVGNANKVILIETENGKVLWTNVSPYPIDSKSKEYRVMEDLDMDAEGNTIVFTTTKYVRGKIGGVLSNVLSPVVVFLDKKGRTISEVIAPVAGNHYSLKLNPDGKELFIKSEGNLFEYQVSYER